MLSIARIADVNYYDNLSREDYYREADSPTQWMGSGAAAFGLHGHVQSHDFRCLFSGYSPDGAKLVQNAGVAKRVPGWDLTFSAPKSVSVLWGVAEEPVRRTIEDCLQSASRFALSILEREAAWSRTGKGGHGRLPAELIVASFRHGTSRALDPNLHLHCLVANVGVGVDGKTRSLHSPYLFRWKMAAGVAFRVALAEALQHRLGLRVERDGDSFKLADFPQALCDLLSTRRKDIVHELDRRGRTSARAAEMAAKDTRQHKEDVPAPALHDAWREVAGRLRFSPDRATQLLGRPTGPQTTADDLEQIVVSSVERITTYRSHFSKRMALREVCTQFMGRSVEAAVVLDAVDRHLRRSRDIVHLSEYDCEPRYTTRAVLNLETQLIVQCDQLHATHTFAVAQKTINRALAEFPGIAARQEQATALRHVVSPGALKTLAGMPGTGKTFVLQAARLAWERDGYRVIGAAVAGRAARELQRKTGIPSETVARLVRDFDATPLDAWKHHAKQVARAALGRPTYRREPIRLDAKTVLVVDEMGMTGTVEAQRLVAEAVKRGAKIVMVGDPQQLSPIGPAGPFPTLLGRYPTVHLQQIERQQDPQDVQAIHALARGDSRAALQKYQDRGLINVAPDRRQAQTNLAADWSERGGLHNPASHVILVTTNADRVELNRRCQEARFAAGQLHPEQYVTIRRKQLIDERRSRVLREDIYVGDRVMFLERSRAYSVENGDLGTVVAYDRDRHALDVQLDGREPLRQRVSVPIAKYQALTLGYAGTTHKFQGATVDYAYVLVGGPLQSREMTYTQLSRARYSTRLYADRLDAGPELADLIRQIDRSEIQQLAHELLRPVPACNVDRHSQSTELVDEDTKLGRSRPRSVSL